jgi:hypothetical protein
MEVGGATRAAERGATVHSAPRPAGRDTYVGSGSGRWLVVDTPTKRIALYDSRDNGRS